MSTLSLVKKSLNPLAGPTSTPILSNSYRGGGDFWMFNADGKGNDYRIQVNAMSGLFNAFTRCAPLNSIILKKAQAFTNGKTWIINKKGKGKDKEAKNPIANQVRNLLANPNPFQGQDEFEAQMIVYIQIFGFSLLLPIKPVGFPNTDATKLWNIPPHMVNVEETKKNWLLAEENKDVIKKIVIDFGNERTEIPLADVYVVKDTTPSLTSPIFPESRICAVEEPVNNIIGSYNTLGRIIDDRGAQGIISSDAKDAGGYIPIKDDEKDEMQKEFSLGYGMKRGQYQYIITSAAVKWTQIVQNTKDLMLFEGIEDAIMRIVDQYGYQYELLSSAKGVTFANKNEAKKIFYQDTVVPEATKICQQLNRFFGLDEYDMELQKDFSMVPAMQQDRKTEADTRKANNEARQIEFYNNLCTLNEWRVANNDDPLEQRDGQDFGNMYYYQLVQLGWKFGSAPVAPANTNSQNNQQEQNTGQAA